jgi:hypothetical protein
MARIIPDNDLVHAEAFVLPVQQVPDFVQGLDGIGQSIIFGRANCADVVADHGATDPNVEVKATCPGGAPRT